MALPLYYCKKCDANWPRADLVNNACPHCKPRNKYNAVKTTVNGRRYDSKHEARQIEALYRRQERGEITDLQRQVRFDFRHNGVLIAFYKADATYQEQGKLVVFDAKGKKTPVYSMKKKMMKAFYGIDIVEG